MAIYLSNKCGLCEICKILMSSFCHLLPPHNFIHILFLLKSWKGVKMVNPISRLPSRRRLWLSSPASEHQPAASNYFSSSSSSPPLLQLLRLLLLLVLLLLLSSHKASANNSASSSFQAGVSLASNNGQVLPGLGRSDLYHEEKDFLDLLSGHPCPPGQPSDQQEGREEADLPCWNLPDQWL